MAVTSKGCPILAVDDEPIIRQAIANTLKLAGYEAELVAEPDEALKRLDQRPFGGILCDYKTPGMSGVEFLTLAKALQPNAARIMVTSALSTDIMLEAINRCEVFRFMTKPWIKEEFIEAIRLGYERYELLAKPVVAESAVGQLSLSHSLDFCRRLVAAHDPVLGKETETIMNLCAAMGRSGHLEPAYAEQLYSASSLVYLGLIGVPQRKYREQRLEVDRRNSELEHFPLASCELVELLTGSPSLGRVVRAAHERWDGAGYPDGLRGGNIPTAARYLAVAVYFVECGLGTAQALRDIVELSGNAFDPEAVRLFSKLNNAELPGGYREVTMTELESGMTLAEDLRSSSGLLLVRAETCLDEFVVNKLKHHNSSEPVTQRIVIYR